MMKQALVSVFCTSHPDSVGNSCRLQLLAELAKRFDQTIITNQPAFIESLNIGSKVVPLPVFQSIWNRIPVLSKLYYAKRIAGFINQVTKGKKLFLFHDTSDYALFIDKRIPIYTCVHQIHEFIGLSQKKGLSAYITRLNGSLLFAGVKKSKVCFANSQTIANYLKKRGLKQDVLITPHFIDLNDYGSNSPQSNISDTLDREKKMGSFILTYTGWVSENRGLQLMLDVIGNLSKSGNKYKLCIVGCQEDYKERIAKYTELKGISNNVFVFGRVNYDLMPAILRESDICLSFLEVNPVYSVSPPQKVVEYFAAGKPVIANHIKTHEFLIEDGKTGFLLDDVGSIYDKVIELSNDKDYYKTVSENALKEAEKYDKNKIMDIYYKGIYD